MHGRRTPASDDARLPRTLGRAGDDPPVRDGALAVHDGRITYVGPASRAPDGHVHDLGDAVILPGLVNVHTHLELTAMRGFLEDLPFFEWIVRLQRAKTTVLTRDSMLDSAKLGIAEGLLVGITTYADTCDSGVALEAMRNGVSRLRPGSVRPIPPPATTRWLRCGKKARGPSGGRVST